MAFSDKNYQYYTQLSLMSIPPKSKVSLAKKLLEFDINPLSPENKFNFYNKLSTFRMPIICHRTTGFLNAQNKIQYYKDYTNAGNIYNNAVQKKIEEIIANGLPDVPDIVLDLNEEKTIPLGINNVSNEENMDKPNINKIDSAEGGKQRQRNSNRAPKRSTSRSTSRKRGGKTRSKSRRSRSKRSKSRSKK